MNFINLIRRLFINLNDSKTAIFSAEHITIIKSIRCTNRSKVNIRLNLQVIALLESPTQEVFIAYNCLVLPNQSIDLLSVLYSSSSEVVEHVMLNGDNLVCYSNGLSEKFDCVLIGYEQIESNNVI